jgi:hypothetical protein
MQRRQAVDCPMQRGVFHEDSARQKVAVRQKGFDAVFGCSGHN